MKWGRETSENCDQDNAINNPSSVHRVRRGMTGQRIRSLEGRGKEDGEVIQKSLKGSRAATAQAKPGGVTKQVEYGQE